MGIFSEVIGTIATRIYFAGDDIKYAIQDLGSVAKDHSIATTAIFTVVTGGASFVAAPFIATTIGGLGYLGTTVTTGAVISELSGAALTSASLAALGGGAASAGGAGMAGGTALIAAVGAGTGAVSSTAVHVITEL